MVHIKYYPLKYGPGFQSRLVMDLLPASKGTASMMNQYLPGPISDTILDFQEVLCMYINGIEAEPFDLFCYLI